MNEHLSSLYAYTLPFHVTFFYVLLALAVLYLVLTQFGVRSKNYVLRIRYFLPIYHMLLSFLVLTGLILWAYYNYELKFNATKMLLILIVLIALSAIGYKRLKKFAVAGELEKFKKFALVKGICEIILIVIAGI
ncbi:hypothetical protein [Campylobacter concisus]|uniref:hypothetical protein n=1 Tax=Campylobacter concisus TaxID=199 RepID=UPI000CD904B1|nr:hypothetical protein [Campylobacter concisus]